MDPHLFSTELVRKYPGQKEIRNQWYMYISHKYVNDTKKGKALNKNVKWNSWELIRAKETRDNGAKHIEHTLKIKKKKTNITQKINKVLEESALYPALLHVFISNLKEDIKLLLIKLDLERKLINAIKFILMHQ